MSFYSRTLSFPPQNHLLFTDSLKRYSRNFKYIEIYAGESFVVAVIAKQMRIDKCSALDWLLKLNWKFFLYQLTFFNRYIPTFSQSHIG